MEVLIEGKWNEVDTSTLFDNQYNLAVGVRVYDSSIDGVRFDERVGKVICPYCGAVLNAGEKCTARPQCSEHTPRSLESLFTKYNNRPVPFRLLNHASYDPVPGKYLSIRRRSECAYKYRVNTARSGATLVFIGNDIYVEGIGYTRIRYGSMNAFPYIPKFAIAALRKILKEEQAYSTYVQEWEGKLHDAANTADK